MTDLDRRRVSRMTTTMNATIMISRTTPPTLAITAIVLMSTVLLMVVLPPPDPDVDDGEDEAVDVSLANDIGDTAEELDDFEEVVLLSTVGLVVVVVRVGVGLRDDDVDVSTHERRQTVISNSPPKKLISSQYP